MSSSSNPGRRHTREQAGSSSEEEDRWFHDGAEVEHPKVAQAFHRGIERAPGGRSVVRVGPGFPVVAGERRKSVAWTLGGLAAYGEICSAIRAG